MSAERYYHQCRAHINRCVEITCHDGKVHRGIVHSVDQHSVYIQSIDSYNGPQSQGPGLFVFGAAFAGGFAGALTGVALGSIFAFRPYGYRILLRKILYYSEKRPNDRFSFFMINIKFIISYSSHRLLKKLRGRFLCLHTMLYPTNSNHCSMHSCCRASYFYFLPEQPYVALLPLSHYIIIDGFKDSLNVLKAESMLDIASYEMPYLKRELPDHYRRFNPVSWSFTRLTNVDLQDPRSFLGHELPGFSLFDTKILVAGEGTNFSNVPIDNSPSINNLVKDSEKTKPSEPVKPPSPPVENEKAEVFFYSTHSYESFLPLLGKTGAKNANLATSTVKNVHLVDQALVQDLEKNGIPANYDQTNMTELLKSKNWGTGQAYEASRPIVKKALSSGNPLKLIIDVHRDSSRKSVTTKNIKGQNYARMSFVIGKENPNYEKNLEITKKLYAMLNSEYPGISRGIFEKQGPGNNGVYNQDLSPHILLIEIGGVDNTLQECQRTAKAIAAVITQYLKDQQNGK